MRVGLSAVDGLLEGGAACQSKLPGFSPGLIDAVPGVHLNDVDREL